MIDFIKNLFRRRALKKNASSIPTGILPLREIRSAVALIDVEDPSFDATKAAIQAFYRSYGIKGEIFFLDFRKLREDERLITSIQTTVLKKDLNWFGMPGREKIRLISGQPVDLFLSLVQQADSFPVRFMATACPARCKVGRAGRGDATFDIVIQDNPAKANSQLEIFEEIRALLLKMN